MIWAENQDGKKTEELVTAVSHCLEENFQLTGDQKVRPTLC